jgi:hypothetical protein
MSGLKGSLDDAYEHAQKVRQDLADAYSIASGSDHGVTTWEDALKLWNLADDLASRIDNLRTALRS